MPGMSEFDAKVDVTQQSQEGSESAKDPAYDAEDSEASPDQAPEPSEQAPTLSPEPAQPESLEQPPALEREELTKRPKSRWVPYERFEQVIRKTQNQDQANKELIRKNLELESSIKELRDNFDAFKTAQTEEPPPDPEEDPEGYKAYQLDTLRSKVESLEKAASDGAKRSAAASERSKVFREYQAAAAKFAETHPDFSEAYGYAMQRRAQAFRAAGYDETELRKRVVDEEMALVADTLKRGGDPAAMLYEIATSSYGWRPKTQAKPGKAVNKSVANAGTLAPGEDEEDIDKMDEAQFERFVARQKAINNPMRA